MKKEYSFNLRTPHLFVLLGSAVVAMIFFAGIIADLSHFMSDSIEVCRSFLLANFGQGDAVQWVMVITLGILLMSSLGNVLWYMLIETVKGVRMKRMLRKAGETPSGKLHAVMAGVDGDAPTVIDDSHCAYAFTAGILSPRIYVSRKLVSVLTARELKAVVLHEKHHQDAQHPLQTFVYEAVRTFFHWIPVTKDFSQYLALRREVSADSAVIRFMDGDKRTLASAMMKSVDPCGGCMSLPASAAHFGHFAHRVDALVEGTGIAPLRLGAMRAGFTVMVCMLLIGIKPAFSVAAMTENDTASTCSGVEQAQMSTINFSPYLRIKVNSPQMTEAVQSPAGIR